jgi:hypothetical protein
MTLITELYVALLARLFPVENFEVVPDNVVHVDFKTKQRKVA